MSLPPLSNAFQGNDTHRSLHDALSLLFEPSDVLSTKLVPQLAALPRSITNTVTTYSAFIDLALATISSWDATSKVAFIAGHPRIGEVKNLSNLSRKEQEARATPPEVLGRLEQLNALYECKYPGLVYITFVNGRSRTEIKDEMQTKLCIDDDSVDIDSVMSQTVPVEVGSLEWMAELERAIGDVGLIAKSRLTVWAYCSNITSRFCIVRLLGMKLNLKRSMSGLNNCEGIRWNGLNILAVLLKLKALNKARSRWRSRPC